MNEYSFPFFKCDKTKSLFNGMDDRNGNNFGGRHVGGIIN